MSFINIYLQGFLVIMAMMTILWIVSIFIKNVSIVDAFWGFGFVLAGIFYFFRTDGFEIRKIIVLSLLVIWGLRLTIYLAWRNWGKGEDFRYKKFRKDYGEHRYWWFSFFQTFLLQGVLMWLISAPLLGAQYLPDNMLGILDFIGIGLWLIGFAFEAGGDYQLARFKADPSNKGKVLDQGFWKLTRHPNYFGDSTIWWAFGLFSISSGSYYPIVSSILMTLLIIKVSGVFLLERSLKDTKPAYQEYIRRTSAFIPWFKKQ